MPSYSDPNTNLASLVRADRPRINPGVYFALLAGVVSLLFTGFVYLQDLQLKVKVATVRKQVVTARSSLNDLTPIANQLAVYDTQAKLLKTLFDGQRQWDVVLTRIESRLYKGMSVSTLQLGEQGGVTTISLTGSVPNFAEYTKVLASFNTTDSKKYFSKVRETSLSRVGDKVVFGLTMVATPELVKLEGSN